MACLECGCWDELVRVGGAQEEMVAIALAEEQLWRLHCACAHADHEHGGRVGGVYAHHAIAEPVRVTELENDPKDKEEDKHELDHAAERIIAPLAEGLEPKELVVAAEVDEEQEVGQHLRAKFGRLGARDCVEHTHCGSGTVAAHYTSTAPATTRNHLIPIVAVLVVAPEKTNRAGERRGLVVLDGTAAAIQEERVQQWHGQWPQHDKADCKGNDWLMCVGPRALNVERRCQARKSERVTDGSTQNEIKTAASRLCSAALWSDPLRAASRTVSASATASISTSGHNPLKARRVVSPPTHFQSGKMKLPTSKSSGLSTDSQSLSPFGRVKP
eukprot:scaffold9786_cov77-Phaeocystis_antarctica.AAC.2